MNALFLTDKNDFEAAVDGGVQICSKEFYHIIENSGFKLIKYYVKITKKVSFRLLRKLKLDAYLLYDPDEYAKDLIEFISANRIHHVFINKSELIRFAPLLKRVDLGLKIIILSHGNETGDYLGELTRTNTGFMVLQYLKIFRLGLNLFIESYLRIRYVDGVFCMSQVEQNIEKWLGAPRTVFIPRIFQPQFIPWDPMLNVVGYVGTLNHLPNKEALLSLFNQIKERDYKTLQIHLVGRPKSIGEEMARNYPFVVYRGELNNEQLLKEVKTWAYFINPIFWYSRGASMKLSQAIGWGIPVITTKAGVRGYEWKNGNLFMCNDMHDMADILLNEENFTSERLRFWENSTKTVANSCISYEELKQRIFIDLSLGTINVDIP